MTDLMFTALGFGGMLLLTSLIFWIKSLVDNKRHRKRQGPFPEDGWTDPGEWR